jgi:hypothetical protein
VLEDGQNGPGAEFDLGAVTLWAGCGAGFPVMPPPVMWAMPVVTPAVTSF